MKTLTAYNGKARDYATHRLRYAADSVEIILQATGLPSGCAMADIAAGTGFVSMMFIGHVGCLIAVEPNAEMRAEAERVLSMHSEFHCVDGTAEDTTLPDRSVDLITVGQAWHWFDAKAAAREFGRILRPDGWVAILWNSFQDANAPDLTALYAPGEARRVSVPMSITESWEQYIGAARSLADAPSVSDQTYPEFAHTQREAFDSRAVGGILTVHYSTEIAIGRLAGRTRKSTAPTGAPGRAPVVP